MAKELTSVSLDKLIPLYGTTKSQADEYKKAADLQNKRIKEKMCKMLAEDENSVDKEVDGWIATYQVRVSESFNENALLEFAKSNKLLKDCVETVEVVNQKKLEDILFKLDMNKKEDKQLLLEIDKFRVQKKTEYLYIKQKKEEE